MSQKRKQQQRSVHNMLGGSSGRAQAIIPGAGGRRASKSNQWDPSMAIACDDELRQANAMLKRLRKAASWCGSIEEEKANRGAQVVIEERIRSYEERGR